MCWYAINIILLFTSSISLQIMTNVLLVTQFVGAIPHAKTQLEVMIANGIMATNSKVTGVMVRILFNFCFFCFFGSESLHTDIDECQTGAFDCSTHSTCSNNDGGYSCNCNAGFRDDNKGNCEGMHAYRSFFFLFIYSANILLDVNECAESTHNCVVNSACENTEGSYLCPCNSGFEGDGLSACSGMHAHQVVIFH